LKKTTHKSCLSRPTCASFYLSPLAFNSNKKIQAHVFLLVCQNEWTDSKKKSSFKELKTKIIAILSAGAIRDAQSERHDSTKTQTNFFSTHC
jgi:hypothetical protein